MGLSACRIRHSRSNLRRPKEVSTEAIRREMRHLSRVDSVGYGLTPPSPTLSS